MRRLTKRNRVREFAAARGWTRVGESEWLELRAALPDISEETLRSVGLEIESPWSGVAQHTLEELETSLGGMTAVYEARADLRRYCREQVIAAKDHARWASRTSRVDEVKRALKAEMVEWMLVWLSDPSLFPAWAALRRENLRREALRRDKIGDCSNT